MKTKDKKALHNKTTAELKTLLAEKRNELINMRMDLAMQKQKNIHAPYDLRKEIAVLETIKKEKEKQNA